MSALRWLGSGPEVQAMHIEVVHEADADRIQRELELVERSIKLVRTSRNGAYRTAALARLERRAEQLRGW